MTSLPTASTALGDLHTGMHQQPSYVTAYGATGNGVTDDTTAIQNTITAATQTVGGTSYGTVVYFPPGTYLTTATLNLPRGVIIRGSGPGSSQILYTGSGAIVAGSGSSCHSVRVENIWLSYASSQSASTAIGISFPTNGGLYYWWSIQGVRITNAYIGIGLGNAGATFFASNVGTESPVIIDESFQSGIDLEPSSGSPGVRFGNIYISNLNVTPASTAVHLKGGEYWFEYLSISGWVNSIMNLNTGADQVVIDMLHIESCTVPGALANGLIDCLGGIIQIGQAKVSVTYGAGSSGNLFIFRVINAQTRLQVRQTLTNVTNSGSGSLFRVSTNTPASVEVVLNQWRDTGADTSAGAGTVQYQSMRNYLGSQARRFFALTDAATVAVDVLQGDYLTLSTSSNRTINIPIHVWTGAVLTFEITNASGGGITTTWNGAYTLAGAWTDPGAGKRRKIQFTYDGTKWVEDFRSAADIT